MEVPIFYMLLKEVIVLAIGYLEYFWIRSVPWGVIRENVENHVYDRGKISHETQWEDKLSS